LQDPKSFGTDFERACATGWGSGAWMKVFLQVVVMNAPKDRVGKIAEENDGVET
jgi:hypothetical protein